MEEKQYEFAVAWGPEDRGEWEAGHFYRASSSEEAWALFIKDLQKSGKPYAHTWLCWVRDLDDEELEEEV